ncbi:hypothetical protein Plec18167_005308 [Paecilomyces lecythidis]|uniref:PXA domain-containing protein n=1 Tax=Paecilomyces lecythidis TaxID=3004212 RepID=A0ABR3XJA5_9EURO
MSNHPRPSLPPLSTPKARPTTSTSKASSISANVTAPSRAQTEPLPRPSSGARLRKAATRSEQADPTDDRATIALIRRILCPQANSHGATTPRPLEELLPPLTSSNEVDRQLYALIAIIIREFVYSWYAKITPDRAFVDEILQLIAHCTRALEQRLRRVDIAELLLDEIPGLIEAHIVSYRTAKQQSDLSAPRSSLHVIYHALNPHPGLSPVPDPSDPQARTKQLENETAYRQLLVQGALAVLLPTEDLENVCLRTLVGDILADLVLGNEVSGRACEGWFVWETMTKLLDLATERSVEKIDGEDAEGVEKSRLEKFGLLSTADESAGDHSSRTSQSQFSIWLWQILQYAYLGYLVFRFVVTGLFRVASSQPTIPIRGPPSPAHPASLMTHSRIAPLPAKNVTKRPVLDYRLYGMLSQLLDTPQRMPWLAGTLALSQHLMLAGPGRLGDTDGVLDRFLHETIQEHVLTPSLLPTLLLAVRTALFPTSPRTNLSSNVNPSATLVSQSTAEVPPIVVDNNETEAPATTATAISSSQMERGQRHDSEVAAIKRQCAERLLSLIPRPVARTFFCISRDDVTGASVVEQPQKQQDENLVPEKGTPSTGRASPLSAQDVDEVEESLLLSAIENEILDPFSSAYCNRHLMFAIIEAILAKLLPELLERDVAELMEDRGVNLSANPEGHM